MAISDVKKLGPGLLSIGEAGTLREFSQQLKACSVKFDSDKDDDTDVLSGDTIAGEKRYTSQLTGTVLQDLLVDGLVGWTWAQKGNQFPFTFVPDKAGSMQVKGTVTVDPLDLGGDVKKKNESEFEWDCVGTPEMSAYTATEG